MVRVSHRPPVEPGDRPTPSVTVDTERCGGVRSGAVGGSDGADPL